MEVWLRFNITLSMPIASLKHYSCITKSNQKALLWQLLLEKSANYSKLLTNSEAWVLSNTHIDQIPTLIQKTVDNQVTDWQTLSWKCWRE